MVPFIEAPSPAATLGVDPSTHTVFVSQGPTTGACVVSVAVAADESAGTHLIRLVDATGSGTCTESVSVQLLITIVKLQV